MRKLLNKIKDRLAAKKVGQFEIFLQSKMGLSLEVKKGKRETYDVKNSRGFGLRVCDHHRLGFSYGTDFSNAAIDACIAACLLAVRDKEPDPHAFLPVPRELTPLKGLIDARFSAHDLSSKFEIACGMEKAAYEVSPQIKNVRNATYEDELETTIIENSFGLCCEQHRSLFHVSVAALAEYQEGSSEMGYDQQNTVMLGDLNVRAVGETAARHALDLLGGRPVDHYRGPVILHYSAATEFLEVLSESFLGDNVAKHNSRLSGKQGQMTYAPQVTLIDDGLLSGGLATSAFDGEGVPQQRQVLVKEGVVQTFLYDEYWGHYCGLASTGNSHRASFTALPRLTCGNFYLLPGDCPLSELFARLHSGFMITDVIGIHTADPVSGDFSVGIQGVQIRNGQKSTPFRQVALSGNLHEIFRQVSVVGSDLKFYGRVGAPSLLVTQAEISGM